jgi:hypothetical protein
MNLLNKITYTEEYETFKGTYHLAQPKTCKVAGRSVNILPYVLINSASKTS